MAAPSIPAEAKAAFVAMLVLAGLASILDVGIIGWLVGPICILLGWFKERLYKISHFCRTW